MHHGKSFVEVVERLAGVAAAVLFAKHDESATRGLLPWSKRSPWVAKLVREQLTDQRSYCVVNSIKSIIVPNMVSLGTDASENIAMNQNNLQKYFTRLGPILAVGGGVCMILLVLWLLGAF
jgi:hypothetical protein